MKICLLIIASLLIGSIVAVDCTGKDAAGKDIPAGCTPKAAGAPAAPAFKITSNVKKANRRTPMEIFNDITASKEDKGNWIIFIKEDPNNAVSSANNKKEIDMYEKFISNLGGTWEGCALNKNLVVDVVEATDPLAAELLLKTGLAKDNDFNKRTSSLVIKNGDGIRIQGPTAYLKIVEEFSKPNVRDILKDTNGGCAKAFFEKEAAAAGTDKCLATNGCVCGADKKKAAAGTAGATFANCACNAAGQADGAATSNNANCK